MLFTALSFLLFAAGLAEGKTCTRPHEHYECGIGCQTKCETLGQKCNVTNITCNKWCYCDDGYARDQTGNCVPVAVCQDRLDGICGPNEVFKRKTYYKDECTGQKLSEGEIPNKRACGCYCKSGYKRNQKGDCVPHNECTYPPDWKRCTRPHEEFDVRSDCERTCDNIGKECTIRYIRPNPGCYCKPGYARMTDVSSPCIPIEDCPKGSNQ